MKSWKFAAIFLLILVPGTGLSPAFAGSLSAALGATKLDGLEKYNNCQRESAGYNEGLIADRLEVRLGNTPDLSPQDRGVWLAEINALREVQHHQTPYRAPDPSHPQRFLSALTGPEQQAVNSMNVRFIQEVNLKCEQKMGGMTRYSPGSDQSGQIRYENSLKAKMVQPMNLAAIPVTPLPSLVEKTAAEKAAGQRAAQDASRQAMTQKFSACQESAKGLRLRITADAMQRKLDASPGLSAKERQEFEADIQAARASADKGLDQIEPVDPKNPYRALQRLEMQDQMDIATEFGKQYTQQMVRCSR